MNLIYIFIGALVILISIFKRELLNGRESFRVLLGISTVLFLIGLALHFNSVGTDLSNGALLMPLISLGYYRLCRKIFVMRYKREPTYTLSYYPGHMADNIFNLVYFGLCGGLGALVPIVLYELAKRGW